MKRFFKNLLLVLLGLVAWISLDWYWPVKISIREFNPATVADLDTKM